MSLEEGEVSSLVLVGLARLHALTAVAGDAHAIHLASELRKWSKDAFKGLLSSRVYNSTTVFLAGNKR